MPPLERKASGSKRAVLKTAFGEQTSNYVFASSAHSLLLSAQAASVKKKHAASFPDRSFLQLQCALVTAIAVHCYRKCCIFAQHQCTACACYVVTGSAKSLSCKDIGAVVMDTLSVSHASEAETPAPPVVHKVVILITSMQSSARIEADQRRCRDLFNAKGLEFEEVSSSAYICMTPTMCKNLPNT
jgi:hypothetical protein